MVLNDSTRSAIENAIDNARKMFVIFNTKYMLLISTAPLLIFMMVLLPYPAIAIESSNGIIINPNTNKIYVFNSDNKSVSVIDGKTDKVLTNVPVGKTSTLPVNIDPGMVAIGGVIITAFVGIITYRQGLTTTRKDMLKDIILPLVNEFNNDSMKTAKADIGIGQG